MAPTGHTSYTVESLDSFDAAGVFGPEREQVVLAVKITPVYSQVDLSLLAGVIEVAQEHGFLLAREHPFKDEWLLCTFETYDDE
jgi:hypothetical protein